MEPTGTSTGGWPATLASVLKGSPAALAATKGLLGLLPGRRREEALSFAADLSAELFASADAAEGMAAFLEKRPPSWVEEPRRGVLHTRLHPGDEEVVANRQAMAALLAAVADLHDQVQLGGGEHYIERHLGRDKLLVRQRLEALVDPGTPVLELSPLAGAQTSDPLGGGVVVALAEVSGTQCLVVANDPTVRGGTTSPTTITKLLRAMDVAEQNRLPSWC